MKTHKFLKRRFTAFLLVLCMVATLLPVTALAANDIPETITSDMKITDAMRTATTNTPGCTFEIALDNIEAGGTLPSDLGLVLYEVSDTTGDIIVGDSDDLQNSHSNFVTLDTDFDNEEDGITLTKGNTGGEIPRVKYTYNVKDTSKYFRLLVMPAEGKTVTVRSDTPQGMTEVKTVTSPEGVMLNVPANAFYRIEFTDAGAPVPGGDQTGPDTAPNNDAGNEN